MKNVSRTAVLIASASMIVVPGSVIAVHTTQGAKVTKGEPLVVVEAMKMEHTLTAPMDGTVGDVLVRVGQQVVVDELLVQVTP